MRKKIDKIFVPYTDILNFNLLPQGYYLSALARYVDEKVGYKTELIRIEEALIEDGVYLYIRKYEKPA